jgi:hypothetical protein
MELEGKIEVVLKPKSGVSQRGPWKSQVVVMKYFWYPNQQYPSEIVLSIFGEERIDRWNLEVNDEVKVRYHAEAREYNGQWYGENRLDALTFIGASAQKQQAIDEARNNAQAPAGAAPQAPQAAPATAQPTVQAQTAQPAAAAEVQAQAQGSASNQGDAPNQDEDEDLPF